MLSGLVILLLIRWRLNVVAMGEEEAMALGVNTNRLRLLITICCSMVTAAAVSISGTIGWVGLVIPHIGRMLVGPDHKKLLPVTVLLGASYLLVIDDIARVMAEVEIPIGILTAIIGAPFFLYLLFKPARGVGIVLRVENASFHYDDAKESGFSKREFLFETGRGAVCSWP